MGESSFTSYRVTTRKSKAPDASSAERVGCSDSTNACELPAFSLVRLRERKASSEPIMLSGWSLTLPTLAMLALEWQIPYLGICVNEQHKQLIKTRLAHMVFQEFQNPRSQLHQPALSALMATKGATVTDIGNVDPVSDPSSGSVSGKNAAVVPESEIMEITNAPPKRARLTPKGGESLRAALLGQLSGQNTSKVLESNIDEVEIADV